MLVRFVAVVLFVMILIGGPVQAQSQLIANGGFESGLSSWTKTGSWYALAGLSNPHSGSRYAHLSLADGTPGNSLVGSMYQQFTLPANASAITLSYWYSISTQETSTSGLDILNVTLQNSSGNYVATVDVYSNVDAGGYRETEFNLLPYAGQTLRINFLATTNISFPTVFRIDDVSVLATVPVPGPVRNIEAAGSANTAFIAWDLPSTGGDPDGYRVDRRVGTGQWAHYDTINDPDADGYADDGLSFGTTYYYRVYAFNGGGLSPGSGDVCVTAIAKPSLTLPAAGAVLASTAVNFNWGAVTGANAYELEVATSCGGTSIYETAVSTPGASTTLNAGSYYWRVRAFKVGGCDGVGEWQTCRQFAVNVQAFPEIAIDSTKVAIECVQALVEESELAESARTRVTDNAESDWCRIVMPPVMGRGPYVANRWPDGIVPFAFAPEATSQNRMDATSAMKEIESVAGVVFVPRTSEAAYIYIMPATFNGSRVGRLGTRQEVAIANWNTFTIVHELMHALGFWHEQQRNDRDEYITINWSRFDEAQCDADCQEDNFEIQPETVDYGEYDFESVMHYASCAFSSCSCISSLHGCRTITVLPPNEDWQDGEWPEIGQLDHLSAGDVAKLLHLYPKFDNGCAPGQQLTISNSGSATLVVDAATSPSWAQVSPPPPYSLNENGTQKICVMPRCDDCSGTDFEGAVQFSSNDPIMPLASVNLTVSCPLGCDPPDCDDSNDCTSDDCVEGSCSNTPMNLGTPCGSSSTSQCNDADTCDGLGECVNRVKQAGLICRGAVNSCDIAELCNGVSATCPTNAFATNGAPCNDFDSCSQLDTCQDGACVGGDAKPDWTPCSDIICMYGAVCLDGECSGGYRDTCGGHVECGVWCDEDGCRNWSIDYEGHSCDDGNACTSGDTCADGECVGITIASSDCPDGCCGPGERRQNCPADCWDMVDLQGFLDCFSGPLPLPLPSCSVFDENQDGYINLLDYRAIREQRFGGP